MNTINTYYEDDAGLEQFIITNRETLFDFRNRSVLVQVFSGICSADLLLNVSKKIRNLVPHAQVIGTTTCGEIMDGEASGQKIVLAFSVFYKSDVKVAFVAKNNLTDFELGQAICSELNNADGKVMILFGTGLTIDASQMLAGVTSINPQIPVGGGNAADNFVHRTGLVICGDEVLSCGVVGFVLVGERLTVNRYWYLGWRPIGKEMTITKSDGLRVYEIDNVPAFKIIRKYLGVTEEDNLSAITEFPLVANRAGMQILRRPYIRHKDDSVGFLANLDEGERIRFSFANMGVILSESQNLVREISRTPVDSIFVYSCSGRRGFLQEYCHVETRPLQQLAATAGFFTYGEYFHSNETNLLLNYTMTVVTLSESDNTAGVEIDPPEINKPFGAGLIDGVLHGNNPTERSIAMLKTLAYLVNTVTEELEERTLELERTNLELWELKKRVLDEELERIARIDLVGQMAASIGHEIRNPLTTVRGFLQLLQKDGSNLKDKEYYDLMISELDRANGIITEYLSLAKNKAVKVSRNNLNDILHKLTPLIQAETFTMKENIGIVYNQEEIPDMLVDESEIRQLVLNLTKNALEATPEFGKVTISTYIEGLNVVLEIKDEGTGIPERILSKIGTPFQTTKETGTGLGLAVCYSIAARHNAKIDISSNGNGTIIRIRFPAE